jgi:antitoxin component YwqK of YwqJK toxin-antitoxin module
MKKAATCGFFCEGMKKRAGMLQLYEPFLLQSVQELMKSLLLLPVFLIHFGSYAVEKEIVYYPNSENIYSEVEKEDEFWTVSFYFFSGKTCAKGKFRPFDHHHQEQGEYMKVYYPNGKIRFDYHGDESYFKCYDVEGYLISYDRREEDKFVRETYYHSGKTQSVSITTYDNYTGVCEYLPFRYEPEPNPKLYICSSRAPLLKKDFYPDGTLLHVMEYLIPEGDKYGKYHHSYFDTQGKKIEHYSGINQEITATELEFFANGQLKSVTELKKGKKIRHRNYNEKGQLMVLSKFNESEQNDSCFAIYRNDGKPKMLIWYMNGFQHGPHRQWHDNGKIKITGTAPFFLLTFDEKGKRIYRTIEFPHDVFSRLQDHIHKISGEEWEQEEDGQPIGKVRAYYSSKNTAMEYTFRNGLLDGDFRVFAENGRELLFARFNEGWLNGPCTIRNDAGMVLFEGHFKNNVLKGEVSKFFANGVLMEKMLYLDHISYQLERNEINGAKSFSTSFNPASRLIIQTRWNSGEVLASQSLLNYDWVYLFTVNNHPNGRIHSMLTQNKESARSWIYFDETGEPKFPNQPALDGQGLEYLQIIQKFNKNGMKF